ncbi:CoA transferase subunit A [Microbulbifer spongiae]|uniref:Acyl CoA--acetate/3-ketoacid CoA transferase subunit alpha n=1 Tax=Microbulbifer spongiae TaxID=2944933 RepID=A0ABY9E7S9_9GAMM|nr:CoA-transferase [Microbulbifer sp. MI-G]WKD49063.1 acyl CoA--acetate/3-ketoacid CoA transferase subunit alpha [Microbulbifer sp. MI-G]
MSKLISHLQAINNIESGMTIGIGGWGPRRKPMALIRELLRSEVRDLTVVSFGGADVGMLCAAGKVKKLVFAFVSLDFIPLEPYFRQARQKAEIDVMEVDEGLMILGLRAAAMGAPFIPTEVGLGTDVIRRNKDIKLIDSPYDDSKEWVAMPALNLDVSLLHVDRADQRGVCQIKGPDHYMDDLFARAAKKTLVSCDELVDTNFFHKNSEEARYVFWERSVTSHVVHSPFGAHPSSCNPLYGIDVRVFREYAASAKRKDGWNQYFKDYISVKESVYLEKVGGADFIRTLPLPIY